MKRYYESDSENQQCFDCRKKTPEWVSVNHGIYVCDHCAGFHRKFSEVRSIASEFWQADQISYLEKGGNRRFREYLESYGLYGLSIGEVYYSKSVEYYRQLLKAETLGRTLPYPPPQEREGKMPYTRVPLFVYEEDRPAMIDPLQGDNSWWSYTKNMVSDTAKTVSDLQIVESVKSGASSIFTNTVGAIEKVKENDTVKMVSEKSIGIFNSVGNYAKETVSYFKGEDESIVDASNRTIQKMGEKSINFFRSIGQYAMDTVIKDEEEEHEMRVLHPREQKPQLDIFADDEDPIDLLTGNL